MSGIDLSVVDWVPSHRTAWATQISRAVMAVGTHLAALGVLTLAVLGYLLVRRRWAVIATVAGAATISLIAAGVVKSAVGRPRPPTDVALVHAGGLSMPSTDGAVTAAVAVALFMATSWSTRRARALFGALLVFAVLGVGIALVYLGVHWPSDVLAGWALGALTAWAWHLAVKRWTPANWHPAVPASTKLSVASPTDPHLDRVDRHGG
ncbi:phosphatase PAP2 family protein [Nakamurella sp. PAMC28650]|uniref:phosphatase PAP2 family protein n=1 Tax=Nakamurella sp. PAMC28650 TaxID=2762325 RepID=UPI00164D4E34|nr:phosphatase PAP2 family protein [Nakamurella sp. PAMC28650]QNK80588.1 phosphatase PAP2 family protein [Nakamurella sp. PAMC28650]